jgi:CBS-domain-containing membrane protein
MNAAEIMTKRVITVRPNTSVGEIADLLLDHKVSAVPVIDDDRQVVGIVSEGDLLGHPPSDSPRAWWLRLFNDDTVCTEEIATARHLKARDVMTTPVVTVVDQTPVDVLATLMRRRRVKRVPVLQNGKLIGIVSHTDLLEALMRRADAADECP